MGVNWVAFIRNSELFQILKDDAVKVLHSVCQQIWKTQQRPWDRKRLVFIPIPKKGNVKECSNYHTIALILHTGMEKAMATHSSTLAWKISWMEEESGRLKSMRSQRVGHNWATSLFTFHFHALEKEMATHSSVLAWRIPWTGEPGGLPSMGSHRVGHDWSDLAAAAVVTNGEKRGVNIAVGKWEEQIIGCNTGSRMYYTSQGI